MIRAAQAQASGKRYPQIAPVLNEQSRRRVAALGAHVGTSEQREFSAVDQDSSIVGATSEADRGREVFGSGLAERGDPTSSVSRCGTAGGFARHHGT
jgi:hypothetical protein